MTGRNYLERLGVIRTDVPPNVARVVANRCAPFLQASLREHGTLDAAVSRAMMSSYLQGFADALKLADANPAIPGPFVADTYINHP